MQKSDVPSDSREQENSLGADFVVQTYSLKVFDQKGRPVQANQSKQLRSGLKKGTSTKKKSSMHIAFNQKENIPAKPKPKYNLLANDKKVSIKIETSRSDSSEGRNLQTSICPLEKAIQTEQEGVFSTKTLLVDEYDEQDLLQHLKDAEVYLRQGDYDRLVEFLYSFRTRYPQTNERFEYRWNVLMAICKLQKREYRDVTKFIEECRRLYDTYDLKVSEQDHTKLLNILGIVYTETNFYEFALLAFQAALTLARTHNQPELFTEIVNNMGVVYLKANMIGEGLELFKWCYHKKIQLEGPDSPSIVGTVFNVAECYTRLEEYESAVVLLKDLRQMLRQNKMDGELCELHTRMMAIEHMRGKHSEAKVCLDLAKQQATDEPNIRYGHLQHQIGLLELTLGEKTRAKKAFEEACKIYVGFTNKDNDLVQKSQANLELASRISK